MSLRTTSTRVAPTTAALVLVTGIGPLATDAYVAGLPSLRHSLHTSAAIAQLTLTAFIIGMAAGQLVIGPLSDSRGRRRLLLAGASVFVLTSLLCALAPTGPVLVAARLVQGLAAGCGVVLGRAVVGDVYRGEEAAKRYGTLAAINFLGPVLAPAVGGVVLTVGTWRAIFVGLAIVGVLMLAGVVWGIPETLPAADRHAQGLRSTLSRMSDLLRDWGFMRHVTIQCLVTAGFFTYIGGSSFVLETVYGISASTYAVVFATNAAAMVLTSTLFRLVVARVGAPVLRGVGLASATTAAVALAVTAVLSNGNPPPLAVPWALLLCITASQGVMIPAAMTLAQEAGRRARGTASALQGGLTFFVGALVTPMTGLLGYASLVPMALLMGGFFVTALGVLTFAPTARIVTT